ncbi:MAG: hypothetical protein ACRENX_07275 [Candidatus Dormibacteria bacterium]
MSNRVAGASSSASPGPDDPSMEGGMVELVGSPVGRGLDARQTVAKIEQKALQLSALLRELDNHPVNFEPGLRDELDAVLDQLGCRIAATRALEQRQASAVAD